jgi:hypothetical protein
MPASQLVSAQHGIIAWSKNADGATAELVVQTAILVRPSMELTGRGVASNIGRPIPTLGVQATITLSEGYWVSAVNGLRAGQQGRKPDELPLASSSKRPSSGSVNRIGPAPSRALLARDRRHRSAQQDHIAKFW